jgi:alpha-amylase
MKVRWLAAPLAGVAVSIAAILTVLSEAGKPEVILHTFDWSYADIAREAETIAATGYRAMLVTPPLESPKSGSCEWWQLGFVHGGDRGAEGERRQDLCGCGGEPHGQ